MVDEGVRLAFLVKSFSDEKFSVLAELLYPLAYRLRCDVHHISDVAAVPYLVDTFLNPEGKDVKMGTMSASHKKNIFQAFGVTTLK